jgi:hypothetical protein
MTQAFFPRSYRTSSAVLVAALCIGVCLTAAGQAPAPAGPVPGAPAVVAVAAGNGAAPSHAPGALTATAEGNEEGGQKPASGLNQSLKMHGHWIIDVKNPDGSLAQHREFDNSLQTAGSANLINLLTGQAVISDYLIQLSGSSSVCGNTYCDIVHNMNTEPADSLCQQAYCTTGLTYSNNLAGNTAPYTMTLSGVMTATAAGNINTVYTVVGICGNFGAYTPASPSSCNGGNGGNGGGGYVGEGPFSGTGITPVSVVANQIVQVTVVFSFS